MITEKFIKQNEKITGSNNYFSHRAKLKNSNTHSQEKGGGGGHASFCFATFPFCLQALCLKQIINVNPSKVNLGIVFF